MTSIGEAISRTTARFLTTEFPHGRPHLPPTPALASVAGGGASDRLNPNLATPLAALGISPSSHRGYATPSSLTDDQTWDLAVILAPFKQDIVPFCVDLAPAAAATGVVDTVLRLDGALLGVNTNAAATIGTVQLLFGGEQPQRALILGSGASSRSAADGLRTAYPACDIAFIARSPERAQAVVDHLGYGAVLTDPTAFAPDLIINTTTVGTGDNTTLDFDITGVLTPGVRYFDLNTQPSALLMETVRRGCVTISGTTMNIITNALRGALLTPNSRIVRR